MERIRITGTGLECGRLGLGTWAIGGAMWGGSDEAESVRTIHAALDRGMDLVDTAPAYGDGRAEEIVGRALAGGRRDRVVLATKAGLERRGGHLVRNASASRLHHELEDSLRRLRTDWIDVYQVHWPDPRVPLDEVASALRSFHEKGLVRAIGVSNFTVAQMEEFRRAAPLHTAQPPLNLLEREAERDVLPWCAAAGVTTLTYGALCRGLLSGRMRPDTRFGDDDLRARDPKFRGARYRACLDAVERLDGLARARFGVTVLELALRWLLDTPGAGVALWGARRPEQLAPAGAVGGFRIDAATRADIDALLAEAVPDPVGPGFMAPPARD